MNTKKRLIGLPLLLLTVFLGAAPYAAARTSRGKSLSGQSATPTSTVRHGRVIFFLDPFWHYPYWASPYWYLPYWYDPHFYRYQNADVGYASQTRSVYVTTGKTISIDLALAPATS